MVPVVLFVCVHNAGRSQMAAAVMEHLGQGRVDVRSAGTDPAASVNPVVIDAMREIGIDIAENRPRALDASEARTADVVITMGCGDECPVFPGVRYEEWDLQDPAGRPLGKVREIREEIEQRVRRLLDELAPSPSAQF